MAEETPDPPTSARRGHISLFEGDATPQATLSAGFEEWTHGARPTLGDRDGRSTLCVAMPWTSPAQSTGTFPTLTVQGVGKQPEDMLPTQHPTPRDKQGPHRL